MKTKMTLVALTVLVNAGCANQINAAIDDINKGIQSSLNSLSGDDSTSTASSARNTNTVYCDDKAVGDSFELNGHTYLVVDNDTARNKSNLQKLEKGQLRYCTSHVTNMDMMLHGVNKFNDIGFTQYSFNQPVDDWDVSNVKSMAYLFYQHAKFNQPLSSWDVSNVTNMRSMFFNTYYFNQPIGSWNVSNVKNMNSMFFNAESFNQPIGKWDVSSVTDMRAMFYNAHSFNQDIRNWDVSNVKNMEGMFVYTDSFDKNSISKKWVKLPSDLYTGSDAPMHDY